MSKERIESILQARIVAALENATGNDENHLKRLLIGLEKKI